MEEQKLYDVVVSGTLYEDGWRNSITSMLFEQKQLKKRKI